MKTKVVQGIKVNVCTDLEEWCKEFYGMPDGSHIEGRDEMESECMGFADRRAKEIWIFVPTVYDGLDLSGTVAHEVGHLMRRVNVFWNEERKAEYYENFSRKCNLIEFVIYKEINNNKNKI